MEERLQAKVVQAEKFVLLDSEGRVRTRIKCITGSPAIQLLDRNGTTRLELAVREESSHQAHVELLGSNGETRAKIWADDSTAQVALMDKNGDSAFLISFIDSEDLRVGPDLWIEGRRGKVRIKNDPNGLPHLVLEDRAGYPRIHFTVDEHGQPHVFRHRAWAPKLDVSGKYLADFPIGSILWAIFNGLPSPKYLHRKLEKFEAQLACALVELGDTPEKIEATLTKLGIMPPTDDMCGGGTLIARYLCWHRRLGDHCEIGGRIAVCWRRFWLLWRLQAFVEMPPAVCDFGRRCYNGK